MCGRYALYGPASRIREQFGLDDGFDFESRYNIAPTMKVLVVHPGQHGERVASTYLWGLVPSWAKDVTIGAKLINARGETVAEKPAFRAAFRRWRCIVPANGFYEWKPVQEGSGTIKQPYFIRPQDDGDLFGFAGLTERWVSPEGEDIDTCCIITTAANELMMPIHDRMPVILAPTDYGAWLDPGNPDVDGLRALLGSAAADGMIAYKVCRAVNSSRGDSPTFFGTGMTQRLRPAVTDPVILMFSRRQVESCDIDEPLELLRSLTADRDVAIKFCGRISLVVDGYNDDPRELFEIPEVRAYIKRLDQEWHYWFFFLSQANESIKLLESCLCETIEVVPGVTSVDMEELERSLAWHLGAMYRLGEQLKLREEMCEEVAEGIIAMFRNAAVERIEGVDYR